MAPKNEMYNGWTIQSHINVKLPLETLEPSPCYACFVYAMSFSLLDLCILPYAEHAIILYNNMLIGWNHDCILSIIIP